MRSPPALRLLALALGREVSTVEWPEVGLETEGPPRGAPEVNVDACTACGVCITICPSSCLHQVTGEGPPILDAGPCVRCGECVHACPEHAISMTGLADLASYTREALVMDGRPPEETGMHRAPSTLYRNAVAGRRRVLIGPGGLLAARSGSLGVEGRKEKRE